MKVGKGRTLHPMAFHLAGQVVAAQRLGVAFCSVRLDPSGAEDSAVEWLDGVAPAGTDAHELQCVVAAAGYAAETAGYPADEAYTVATGVVVRRPVTHEELLLTVGPDDELSETMRKARALVEQNRRTIALVAQQLLVRLTLDDVEVEVLVDFSDGTADMLDLTTYRLMRGDRSGSRS